MLFDPLNEVPEALAEDWGRPRDPGNYALAALHFASGTCVDIEPWWSNTTDADWQNWGFEKRPGYSTVHERLCELETDPRAIDRLTECVSRVLRFVDEKSGGRVLNDVSVDATESRTFARLRHDCQPGETCPWRGKRRSRELLSADPGNAQAGDVRRRHADAASDEDEVLFAGEAQDVKETADGGIRVRVGGHWYRLLDDTAGVRAYTGPGGRVKRFWVGFYNAKITSHYFGAPVWIKVTSASRTEHHIYPELMQELRDLLGRDPRRLTADKGYSVESVFKHNTERGISSVIPWRRNRHDQDRKDKPTHNRYGQPFCKRCGGPTRFVAFSRQNGGRITFQCTSLEKPGCENRQTITCSTDYRLLIPLWRDTEAYIALADNHKALERVHDDWRSRYGIAADCRALTPKRRGAAWQQLRCHLALIIEWLKIAHIHGYLDGKQRNPHPEIEMDRTEALAKFRQHIRNLALRSPLGYERRRTARRRRSGPITRGQPPPAGP